ncbi:unnamed protein product, partial [marine sediment metagenome]
MAGSKGNSLIKKKENIEGGKIMSASEEGRGNWVFGLIILA